MEDHSPFISAAKNYSEFAQMGIALDLLSKTERKSFSISTIEAFIRPPIQLCQIELALCRYRELPRAMLCYAYLSDVQLTAFGKGVDKILHLSEWNEGTNFYLVDVLCPFGDTRNFLTFAFSNLERKPKQVYFRSQKSGRVKSVSTEKSGFLNRLVG